MISKELLSLVLGYPVEILEERGNEIFTKTIAEPPFGSALEQQNKDTISRLCKEWCYEQMWNTTSNLERPAWSYSCGIFLVSSNIKWFSGDTELEAITKATEWVAKKRFTK